MRLRRRDRGPERLRVGVVAVVEDGEPSCLHQLAPAARHRELLQSAGPPDCEIEPQLLNHRPDTDGVVRLMEPAGGQRESGRRS